LDLAGAFGGGAAFRERKKKVKMKTMTGLQAPFGCGVDMNVVFSLPGLLGGDENNSTILST
jgi:hypothetical protein